MSGPEEATDHAGTWNALWKSGQDLAAALQSQTQEVAAKIQSQAHDLAEQVSSKEWRGKVTTAVQQATETIQRKASSSSPIEKPIKRNTVIKLASRVYIIPFPEKHRVAAMSAALPDNCKIFNMSERTYDTAEMFPSTSVSIVDVAFPGLPYPPLVKMAEICLQTEQWLNEDSNRCVALHCIPSGLPTRTLVVSACLLYWLFPGEYSHPLEAVPKVCKSLPLKEEDLLPSQRRYLSNFYRCVSSRRSVSEDSISDSGSEESSYLTPLPVNMNIVKIIVKANDKCDSDSTPLANPSSKVGWRPYLDLWQQGRKLYSSWEAIGDDSVPAKRSRVDEPVLTFTIPNGGITVSNDVILRLRTYPGPHTVFRVPLSCPGVLYHDKVGRIRLSRADLDGGVLSAFVDDVEVVVSFDDTEVDEDNPAIQHARQVLADCRSSLVRHYTEDVTKSNGAVVGGRRPRSKSNGKGHRSKEGRSSSGTPKDGSKAKARVVEKDVLPPPRPANGVDSGVVTATGSPVKDFMPDEEAMRGMDMSAEDAELGIDDLYGLMAADDSWGAQPAAADDDDDDDGSMTSESAASRRRLSSVDNFDSMEDINGSSSSSGSIREDEVSHLYVFTAHKGGMDNVDKKLQLQVIEEMSKNSSHHEAAIRRDKKVNERIEVIKSVVAAMTGQERQQREAEAQSIIANARKHCACDSERWCCVVDMDMFYAAVEIRDDPKLRDVPLAVGGESMISTANYVARKYGVRAAMPGFIARELCKRQGVELKFKPVDMPRYQAASALFKDAVSIYGPMRMLSLDEAYIDITGSVRELAVESDKAEEAAAGELVMRMRREVYEKTNGLTCSAGIAKGCFRLAKMGSDVNKPDGQFMVPTQPHEMLQWLQGMPIRKVSERQLSAGLGIDKVGDVITKAPELLCAMSSNGGHWLISAAMGVADSEDVIGAVDAGPKSISQERSLSTREAGSSAYLHEVLQELCVKVIQLCQEKGQFGRCVTVKLKTFEWDVKQKSNTLKKEVRTERLLYETASELMGAALVPCKKPIRLLGVKVSSFNAVPQGQSTLVAFLAAHPPSALSSQTVEGPGGVWSCSVCTFLNKPSDDACEMCGIFRGKRPREAQQPSRDPKAKKANTGGIEKYLTKAKSGTRFGAPPPRAYRRAADLGDDDDDDGIPVIPDLDDEQEEDLTRQVAAPPTGYVLELRGQRELEEAAGEQKSTSGLRGGGRINPHPEAGIDLSILLSNLLTPAEVEESDVVWDHDVLLQQLASELTAAAEQQQQQKEGGHSQQPASGPPTEAAAAEAFDAPVESNRQRKRNKRREQKKEKWQRNKRKKSSIEDGDSTPAAATGGEASDNTLSASGCKNPLRRERNGMMRADTEARALMSPMVLFDCEFRAQMHTRETISLAQQLMFCYGANKKCAWPLRLVTACPEDGDMHQHLRKNSGLANWVCFTLDHRPLQSICASAPGRFVYLTADSDEVMWSFEPNCVYIIGGLVDKNRHKNITKEKADELGLRTARLPLGEVVDMGEHSKVLTVNHVLEIMAQLWQRQHSKKSVTEDDWREVCLECLPGRKVEPTGSTSSEPGSSGPETKRHKTAADKAEGGSPLKRPRADSGGAVAKKHIKGGPAADQVQQGHHYHSKNKMARAVGAVNEECTVFMSGLPFTTKEADIENALNEGDSAPLKPTSIRLVRDRNGHLKGFAYVDFASHSQAQRAADLLDKRTVHGNKIFARISRPTKPLFEPTTLVMAPIMEEGSSKDEATLDASRILAALHAAGCPGESVTYPRNPEAHLCYVHFEKPEEADKCLALETLPLEGGDDGLVLRIDRSIPKKGPNMGAKAPQPKDKKALLDYKTSGKRERTLFIQNLAFETDENTLESFVKWSMAEQGLVTGCHIVCNKRGKSRGFGYLELATKEAADKVSDTINGCELNGRAIKVSPSDRPITSVLWSVAWRPASPECPMLAVCGQGPELRLYVLEEEKEEEEDSQKVTSSTLKLVKTITTNHTRTLRRVNWLQDGKTLVIASFDASVSLWAVEGSDPDSLLVRHRATIQGHENEVKNACFSPSGRYLATCSRDKTIWVWEECEVLPDRQVDDDEDTPVEGQEIDFECVGILQGHSQDVKSVAWHPCDDNVLFSASYDDTIRVWSRSPDGGDDDWHCIQTLKGNDTTVWALSLIDAGVQPLMISVAGDGAIKAWLQQAKQSELDRPLELPHGTLGLTNWYTSPAFSGYTRTTAVRVEADRDTWECVDTIRVGNGLPVFDVDTVLDATDGTIIAATAGGDNSVRIFAYTLSSTGGHMSANHEEIADSAKLLGRRQTHTSDVNSAAFLPDRRPDGSWLLASVGDDETVKLWKGSMTSNPTETTGGGLPVPLRQELQLDDKFNLSRVCSSYNGHDNEAYKVKYWSDLVAAVLQYEGGVATTCEEIRKWWARYVNPRQALLPSLPTILSVSDDLRTDSQTSRDYAALWALDTSDGEAAVNSGFVSRIANMALGLVWGTTSSTDPLKNVADDTIVFSTKQLTNLAGRVLRRSSSYENSVLTLQEFDRLVDEELAAMSYRRPEFGLSVTATGKTREAVLACMASLNKASVFCEAVGTESGMLRGVKVGSSTAATPAEKANLVHRIAMERIDSMEESLTTAWSKADSRARDHLRAGRKPLALQALKERSIVQGRLDEIGKYRLQLQSSSGMTATAEIQSIVVDALSASTQMAKEQKVSMEQVDRLAEDIQEVQDEIDMVSDAMAAMTLNTGQPTEEDPELQAELERIMKEQEDIEAVERKAQVTSAPAPPTGIIGEKAQHEAVSDTKADSTANSPSRQLAMAEQPV
ncbi:cytosolic iron-sulfur protein assembly [Perkinsus chesapeaki]|uniref:Probable cytosolic iron-sulfur protein assembly protein CIAO1 homolog n=1 Tax=Perkinsus chesapeaki TaxID=330153 RepID=A0A7J6N0U3_PERCH|nr:cytosolic iron-sulfur protein assembly [Perkinsus chesapeaki]